MIHTQEGKFYEEIKRIYMRSFTTRQIWKNRTFSQMQPRDLSRSIASPPGLGILRSQIRKHRIITAAVLDKLDFLRKLV